MRKTNAYFMWGLTAFFTVCAIMLVYDTFFSTGTLILFTKKLLKILAPILYGVFIAYLLTPVVNFFERKLFPKLPKKLAGTGKLRSPLHRTASIVLTFLVVFFLFYLLLSILIPELYKSVVQLAANLGTYYNTILGWIQKLLEWKPEVGEWVTEQFNASYQNLLTYVTTNVIPQAQQLLSAVTGGVMDVLIFFKDMVIGIIVSIYLLATKEDCGAACRKLLFSIVPEQRSRWILSGVRRTDFIFSGFVRGKLLDSLIIGVLCFICCSFLKMPYTPLVSVIVGVTNVIPFFGPFLGAIPSAFLILLVDPLKCLYFIIFVLVLQQVDGNIIGPRILGGSTGLSSFWVIVAILVGGGLFGLPGMFFGVPICACLQAAIKYFADLRLQRRGLPTDPMCYTSDIPRRDAPEEPKQSEK